MIKDKSTIAIAAIYSSMLEARCKKESDSGAEKVEVDSEADTDADTDGDEPQTKEKEKGDPAVTKAPVDDEEEDTVKKESFQSPFLESLQKFRKQIKE